MSAAEPSDNELDALFDADPVLRAAEEALLAGSDAELSAEALAWQENLSTFDDTLVEVAPSAGVWDRLSQAIDDLERSPTTYSVHTSALAWEFVAPGVTRKLLHLDVETGWQATILKLEAGAYIPPHNHTLAEECLILDGTLEVDGVQLKEGDFHIGFADTEHSPVFSPTGATLYIRGGLGHQG